MLPVIAIVGRPNVGKSTLFNRMTRSRDAIVSDVPGLTRDRQYGEGEFEQKKFIVIDTGGLELELNAHASDIEALMAKQALQAVTEADVVLFMVDARDGLVAGDQVIAELLRKRNKNALLVVNKIDGLNYDVVANEFYSLGFGDPYLISAEHKLGTEGLLENVLKNFPDYIAEDEQLVDNEKAPRSIKIAFIGRPNSGKSTLMNRILGEERVIVSEVAGTTRDSIFVNFNRRGKDYILIDTAGVRKRGNVNEKIEKFSVIKTLQAIAAANVIVMLIDAKEGLAEQDLWLLGFAIDAGKALVIAVNKWDNLPLDDRAKIRKEIDRRLSFVDFAKIHFISALHGSGVGTLFVSIDQAYKSASRTLETPELTRILQAAVAQHNPLLVKGRRIKLRYAHAGGRNPPIIIIHGNQVNSVPDDYRRYLAKYFRKALRLSGTPVKIEFKGSKNPYLVKSK